MFKERKANVDILSRWSQSYEKKIVRDLNTKPCKISMWKK